MFDSHRVSAQRQEYKLFKQGKKCRITAERVQALNAIGFVWEAQRGSSGAVSRRVSSCRVVGWIHGSRKSESGSLALLTASSFVHSYHSSYHLVAT